MGARHSNSIHFLKGNSTAQQKLAADQAILQICLSPAWGGLEMVTFETALRYAQRGIPCVTACLKGSRLHAELKKHQLPSLPLLTRKYFGPKATLALHRFLKRSKISTVLVQHLADLWVLTPALIGFRHVKVLGISHSFLNVYKRDLFHYIFYRRLNHLVCLTELQKKNLLKHLPIESHKISIIPNSVDFKKFSSNRRSLAVRQSLGAAPDEIIIGVVSRLDPLKGQHEAVQAAVLLKAWGFRFKIVFVGEDTINTPGTGQELQKQVKAHDLQSHVFFAGYRSDVEDVVASLDILFLPSKAETFGRVLLEAMASQVPIIATAAGGIPDIIAHGYDGLLVPAGDIQKMAMAMKVLIADANLRKQIADRAYKKALTTYSLKDIEIQMDELIFAKSSNPVQLTMTLKEHSARTGF